ncbi:hypothetical protein ROZALSC1DRAFT_31148 [Rozella allomycis CSF55]|uniref:Uncharacterized protein n=1 Tax=Rozella allomycis (strain CSF55) TaxID=988480 RepID=A0A4P9YEE5_ROZAC|nr:hypothetical protein ROZALSC1DRAFT_31148 [Rozella allomycis CSF55]
MISYLTHKSNVKVVVQHPNTILTMKPFTPHAVLTVFPLGGNPNNVSILIGPNFIYEHEYNIVDQYVKLGSGWARSSRDAVDAILQYVEYFSTSASNKNNLKKKWKDLKVKFWKMGIYQNN